LIAVVRLILATTPTSGKDDGDENENQFGIAIAIAIAKMCRLAQSSVKKNLEQYFASHSGAGKRKSRHMFASLGHGGGDQQQKGAKTASLLVSGPNKTAAPEPSSSSSSSLSSLIHLFWNNLAAGVMLLLRYSALDLKVHCHMRPAASILMDLPLSFSECNPYCNTKHPHLEVVLRRD
jgi:hypothetical protein